MKALITGADGLLGANLTRELLARGWEARALIQPGSRSKGLDGLEVERIEEDLLAGAEALAPRMKGCDAVFHLAAVTNQWATPELTWSVNYDGARAVIKAWKTAQAGRLIFTGSASSYQFGTMENPGDESSPFPPAYRGIPYMESKHKAAEMAREEAAKGFDIVIVAPTFLLGAFDSGPSSGELIRQYLKRGAPLVPPGGRNFVHAGDAAKAAIDAFANGRAGETYILGNENLSYLEFFTMVAGLTGRRPPRGALPKAAVLAGGALASMVGPAISLVTGKKSMVNYRLARLSTYTTYYNAEKARRELGLGQTPIEQAIKDSLESLKDYGHLEGIRGI